MEIQCPVAKMCRLELLRLGYSPLAIRDKAPFYNGWQNLTRTEMASRIENDPSWDVPSTGVRLDAGLAAVDIDVRDNPELVEDILETLPKKLADAPVRGSTGSSSVAVFFRSTRFGSFSTAKFDVGHVEFWCDPGRQFGAYGPKTGDSTYFWKDGTKGLLDFRLEDLPKADGSVLRKVRDAVEAGLAAIGVPTEARRMPSRPFSVRRMKGRAEYILNRDMSFEVVPPGTVAKPGTMVPTKTLAYDETVEFAKRHEGRARCTGSFLPQGGEVCFNPTRFIISVTRADTLVITDFDTSGGAVNYRDEREVELLNEADRKKVDEIRNLAMLGLPEVSRSGEIFQ